MCRQGLFFMIDHTTSNIRVRLSITRKLLTSVTDFTLCHYWMTMAAVSVDRSLLSQRRLIFYQSYRHPIAQNQEMVHTEQQLIYINLTEKFHIWRLPFCRRRHGLLLPSCCCISSKIHHCSTTMILAFAGKSKIYCDGIILSKIPSTPCQEAI